MDRFLPPWLAYFFLLLFGGLGLLMLLWRKGPNWWIGVRLPWTYADRDIWDKSWRLAAIFLMGMGLGPLIAWKFFVIALLHLVILGISYPVFLYWRKYHTLRVWKDMGWIDYRPVARCRQCGHYQKLVDAGALQETRCEACGVERLLGGRRQGHMAPALSAKTASRNEG